MWNGLVAGRPFLFVARTFAQGATLGRACSVEGAGIFLRSCSHCWRTDAGLDMKGWEEGRVCSGVGEELERKWKMAEFRNQASPNQD